MSHVFISYSHEDLQIMQRIKRTLTLTGFNVWTDENIPRYTLDWELEIENAIENSFCVICNLTPNARVSHWVRKELAYAMVQEKLIYMVHTEGNMRDVTMLRFANHQIIDVRDDAFYEPRMKQLCNSITADLKKLQGSDSDAYGTSRLPSDGYTQGLPDSEKVEKYLSRNIVEKNIAISLIPEDEMHILLVQRGQDHTTQNVFTMMSPHITLGNDDASTIFINHPSVSRQHCQLIHTKDGFVVQDLNSTNGTYINSDRVSVRTLKSDDELQIGPGVSFLYRKLLTQ